MTDIIEVPSPFCGIGTDDLSVRVSGLNVQVLENGCAINTPAFELPLGDRQARVRGEPVALEVAITEAAALLMGSCQPAFGGCATDVAGMRALLALADKIGAVVDNGNFSAARNNFLALQDSGWMNCTLAEVKNRCDLLLVVGTDLEAFAPRFFERYIWTEGMFVAQRQVIYLGASPSGELSTAPDGSAAQVLKCANADLPAVLAVLRALLKGQIIQADLVGGIALSELQALATRLQAAQYSVVTWGAGALAFSQAELSVQMLCEMIKELNKTTRCSGLPLGGKDGDQTANQVCGWTTGYPARVNFAKGYPQYDPFLYDSRAMLAGNEIDVLVWVNAFNVDAAVPASHIPTIVIGRSAMRLQQQPTVFIPVGTPGIDHTGHAYRMDNVVAIRLKKLRDSGLASSAEVLNAITQALLSFN